MGLFDKFFNDDKNYIFVNRDLGLRIKELDNGKIQYIISGKLAKECNIDFEKNWYVGDVLQIGLKGDMFESEKIHHNIGDTNMGEYQKHYLMVDSQSISDFKVENNLLLNKSISFVVDDQAKCYVFGDVERSPYAEDQTSYYTIDKPLEINREDFNKALDHMLRFDFFKQFSDQELIPIPKELSDKVHRKNDEYGISNVYFDRSSTDTYPLVITGYKVEKEGEIYIQPTIVQTGANLSTHEERVDAINAWAERQFIDIKEMENKAKESAMQETNVSDIKSVGSIENSKESATNITKFSYVPQNKYNVTMPNEDKIPSFKLDKPAKFSSLKIPVFKQKQIKNFIDNSLNK